MISTFFTITSFNHYQLQQTFWMKMYVDWSSGCLFCANQILIYLARMNNTMFWDIGKIRLWINKISIIFVESKESNQIIGAGAISEYSEFFWKSRRYLLFSLHVALNRAVWTSMDHYALIEPRWSNFEPDWFNPRNESPIAKNKSYLIGFRVAQNTITELNDVRE